MVVQELNFGALWCLYKAMSNHVCHSDVALVQISILCKSLAAFDDDQMYVIHVSIHGKAGHLSQTSSPQTPFSVCLQDSNVRFR